MKKSLSQLSLEIYLKKLFPVSGNVLCTVSGGQDSQLLFYILLHLKKYCHLTVHVIYMHHFWQISNFQTFFQVWKMCFLFQIPFSIILTEKSVQSEDHARNWRKEGFYRISQFYKCQYILTGHTATDYIESSLWNLIRGTSPHGLAYIKKYNKFTKKIAPLQFLSKKEFVFKTVLKDQINPNLKVKYIETPVFLKKTKEKTFLINNQIQKLSQKKLLGKKSLIPIFIDIENLELNLKKSIFKFNIRSSKKSIQYRRNRNESYKTYQPLFDYYRSDITKIIKSTCLPIIPDPTNQSQKWTRNKIRLKLIPTIKNDFHNQFDRHIYRFLELNSSEQQFLQNLICKICENSVSRSIFTKLPQALQRKFLHTVCESYTSRQITWVHIEVIHTYILNDSYFHC